MHPREVIEAALAHVVRNRVEAAYARSDLFERRRILVVSEPGLTDEKGKCGGYLEKCDTNGRIGRITCAEARKCGLKTPLTKDHPAYKCMTDRDKDGVACE